MGLAALGSHPWLALVSLGRRNDGRSNVARAVTRSSCRLLLQIPRRNPITPRVLLLYQQGGKAVGNRWRRVQRLPTANPCTTQFATPKLILQILRDPMAADQDQSGDNLARSRLASLALALIFWCHYWRRYDWFGGRPNGCRGRVAMLLSLTRMGARISLTATSAGHTWLTCRGYLDLSRVS